MNAMFRSLQSRNYRVWFIGALVSNAGTWMQSTAQNWVVLTELSDGNASAVGITMALQFAPPLLLVAVTGWVADRFDRRKILLVSQTLLAMLGVTVGILLITGIMTLPLMWVFAGTLGVVTAFDNPARQAFVSDLVGQENMSNAVALNSASFNTARLVGPALAGLLIIAVGTGWVFLINAATFGAMIIALLLIKTGELTPRAPRGNQNRLTEGFRYVSGRKDLLIVFMIVFIVGAFGMNFPIIASTMALEFGQGADGFGLLNSVLAIGSLAGALLAARRAEARIRVVIWASGLYAAASLASAFMPSYWLYAITLMFVGFSVVTLLTTANAVVQTTTSPALRGRVLALYMAVVMGGTPLGAPIIGWVAEQMGPRIAIMAGSAAAAVVFIIGMLWLTAGGRVNRVEGSRFKLAVTDTRPIMIIAPEEFSDELAQTTPVPLPERFLPRAARSEPSASPTQPAAPPASPAPPTPDAPTSAQRTSPASPAPQVTKAPKVSKPSNTAKRPSASTPPISKATRVTRTGADD